MEGRIIGWALMEQLHLETKLCSEVSQTWMVFFSSAWPSARIFFDTVHEPCCCYFKKLRSIFFINRISSDLPIFGMEFQIASWPSSLCTIFIWFFSHQEEIEIERWIVCVPGHMLYSLEVMTYIEPSKQSSKVEEWKIWKLLLLFMQKFYVGQAFKLFSPHNFTCQNSFVHLLK